MTYQSLDLRWCLGISGLVHTLLGLALVSGISVQPQVREHIEVAIREWQRPPSVREISTAPKRPALANDTVSKVLAMQKELPTPVEATSEPALDSEAMTQIQDQYIVDVVRQLNRHKVYPESALRLRQQGKILVRFKVDRSGRIVESAILEPSRHLTLNRAAQTLIDEIRSFKPFPNHIREAAWAFTVPIEYSM